MQWRVILWRCVLLAVIGGMAVLIVRFACTPPASAVAQSAEEQADAPQQPGVNALAPMGYTSPLGYLPAGRKTTIVGGTTEGVHVYELGRYGTEYEVSDATEGAEDADDER